MDVVGPPEQGPSEGWLKTRFHTTPKMSTYILCYTVMDFKAEETVTTTGVRVNYITILNIRLPEVEYHNNSNQE